MKIKNQLLGAAIVSVATVATAAPSYALTTLIESNNSASNYPTLFGTRASVISPSGTTGTDEQGNTTTSGQQKAVSFITPTNAAPEELELNNLEILLQSLDESDGAAFDFSIGSPTATPVLTLDNDDITTPFSNGLSYFTYVPSTPFSFTAGTTYYLTATAANSSYSWITPAAENQTAPSGLATFNGYEFSDDGGDTFSSSSQFNTFAIETNEASAAVPFDFSATPGLFLIGGLWGANKMRRRKSSAKLIED